MFFQFLTRILRIKMIMLILTSEKIFIKYHFDKNYIRKKGI
jgi:hypothetical protein